MHPQFRPASACLVVIFLVLIQGCANLPPASSLDRQHSTAISNPESYPLGEFLSHDERAVAGQSAYYLLANGEDALLSRLALIQSSRKSLDLQYYIYRDDDTGRLISSALLDSADRGVRVRLLLDDVGVEQGQIPEILDAHPNVEVRRFNPLFQHFGLAGKTANFIFDMDRATHRMHNKSFIADNAAAIVGGRNISDRYFNASSSHTFADLDLLLTGPVVEALSSSFDLFWNSDFAYPLEALRSKRGEKKSVDKMKQELKAHEEAMYESSYMAAIRETPLSKRLNRHSFTMIWAPSRLVADPPEKVEGNESTPESTAFHGVLDILDAATVQVLIISPYVIPLGAIKEKLVSLADRGVDVKILTNSYGTTDNNLAHGVYMRSRDELLESGIDIYELKKTENSKPESGVVATEATLHAKAIVVDHTKVIIGSMNFDPRSYYLNTELALVLDSEVLADVVEAEFARVIAPGNSFHLKLEEDGIVWRTEEDGKMEAIYHEPNTTLFDRFSLWLFGLVPLKDQL